MRTFMQSFNDLKIRNKFLIVYILSVFLPIVVSNSFFYMTTTKRFLNQKETDIELVVTQTQEEFRRLTDQAIGMATTLYLDVRLYDFFDQNYDTAIEYVEAYNYVLRQYGTSTPLYHSIQNINFFTENPTVIHSGGVHTITDQMRTEQWYGHLKNNHQPIIYREEAEGTFINLSIFQELNYFYLYDQYETIVRIDMNPLALRQVFHNVTLQGDLYLLDERGQIVYTNNQQIDWEENQLSFNMLNFSSNDLITKRVIRDNYLENWQIVGVVDTSAFIGELFESSRFIIVLSIINFILPTLIIVFISKSFHSRLAKVLQHMKSIEDQQFEEYPYVKSKDEIGQLTRQINRMTRKINQLFNEVFKANLAKKDLEIKEKQAQLSALKSQINPHFLFNSLETIRMRCLMKNELETANIIEHMAGIFRNAITWNKEWVTIENEVQLIKAFLEIQTYRFGDKLTYHLDVDDQIMKSYIPNLSFLPFVENASIHGIEPLKGQGEITITIGQRDGCILFEIRDNGVGIAQPRLNAMMKQLENDENMGNNIGLQNVYYRLKLYFQEQFTFQISTELNKGTTIILQLPIKYHT
ncbi:sensor histidine kinase [Amphibacillus jilinensis]|uniref:sensor histidine kinase n=1 Tax=Amphibacillus jilinensis TaxID=1216008 RepID=UPI0002D98D42|nr:sensor histidine kinase [Amphibacillus jilinensis]